MVIGDHAAHQVATTLTGAGGLLTFFPGFPSTLRGRAGHDLRQAPRVSRNGSRLHVEVPSGASLLGPFHHVAIPISVWGWAPATIYANIGLDADPTARDAGLNVFFDGDVDIDVPDFVKWLTGLVALEHGMAWGPLTIILESVVFGLADFDLLDLDMFSTLLYSRRDLTPSSPTPQLISGSYGGTPVGSDRIDWWDIVFVSDGFPAPTRATYDAIVAQAASELTAAGGPPSGDVGAGVWDAFSGAIRVWSMPLTHSTRRLSTDDGRRSAIRDMAAVAEAGVIFDDHLADEYPDAPPIPGRTTWVFVRPSTARAMAFGNFVLLPVDAGDTPMDRVEVLIHELGHLRFAALADEYQRRDDGVYRGPEPRQPNISTSRAPDKWSAFTSLITPTEGAYERYPFGMFRPTATCRMRSAGDSTLDFCPVCKSAISNGVMAHLTSGSGPLQPPLSARVRFRWPFVGDRTVFTGAGIGAGGHVPNADLPYLELGSLRLNTRAQVDVVRAAVPRPHIGASVSVDARPREVVRLDVRGTHPNIGFPTVAGGTQSATFAFSDRLTLDAFAFAPPSDLAQSAAGRPLPVGGEIRATVDRATGELRTDVVLSARAGGGATLDLRLATATVLVVDRLGDRGDGQMVTFADGLSASRREHARDFSRLELGQYRWRAETRLAPESLPDPADYYPSRYVLGSQELGRGRSDYHFAVRGPEPADAPPQRPVPIAAGRVRISLAVDRGGGVIEPAPDERRSSGSRLGFINVPTELRAEVLGKGRPFPMRFPGLGGWRPGWPPEPNQPGFGGFGGGGRGPDLPDPGTWEGWVGREPPQEFIVTTRIVMLAWSWSPAAESLRMEFQILRGGGRYAAVAPDHLAILQRGSWADPDAPFESVRVSYWEYTDDDAAAEDRWRCRAIDRSGRASAWSQPAPLIDFNTRQIPARLGTPY